MKLTEDEADSLYELLVSEVGVSDDPYEQAMAVSLLTTGPGMFNVAMFGQFPFRLQEGYPVPKIVAVGGYEYDLIARRIAEINEQINSWWCRQRLI